jgi:hypothetical protein
MTLWLWIALISNLIYGTVFAILARRRRAGAAAIVVGVVHLLLAGVFSVAPIRSAIDPHYPGLAFGILRFEGRSAVLPAATVLIWALSCAFVAVGKGAGRAMWWIAAFDLLMAANLAAGILSAGNDNSIQFGEHFTIPPTAGLTLMLLLFVLGPAASGVWSARRALRPKAA